MLGSSPLGATALGSQGSCRLYKSLSFLLPAISLTSYTLSRSFFLPGVSVSSVSLLSSTPQRDRAFTLALQSSGSLSGQTSRNRGFNSQAQSVSSLFSSPVAAYSLTLNSDTFSTGTFRLWRRGRALTASTGIQTLPVLSTSVNPLPEASQSLREPATGTLAEEGNPSASVTLRAVPKAI